MAIREWRVIILAASRGPEDPMAKAYGVAHKCALPVHGQPMLRRVVAALNAAGFVEPYCVSIDDAATAKSALGPYFHSIETMPPQSSAPASARAAIENTGHFPVFITTGDHPLLTAEMLQHFVKESEITGADVLVALATSDVISARYPETKRTYFNLGGTRVSGCNLFAITNPRGVKLVETWQEIERDRKAPWKLVSRFGLWPLISFATGRLTPDKAFGFISKKLGISVAPIFMPFAEAAIDVDKPSDLELAEKILVAREGA
jgi:GTP:adenosylcobinamide-phosphate guanylyltransferase